MSNGQKKNQTSPQDPKTLAAQRDAERKDFYQRLQRVFDTPDGKLVLGWLHSTASTRKPRFRFPASQPGEPTSPVCPYRAAFRDGRASLVEEIEANLDQARESYGKKSVDQKPRATR